MSYRQTVNRFKSILFRASCSAINKHMFDGLDFTLRATWIEMNVHNMSQNTAGSPGPITVVVYSTCSGKCV